LGKYYNGHLQDYYLGGDSEAIFTSHSPPTFRSTYRLPKPSKDNKPEGGSGNILPKFWGKCNILRGISQNAEIISN
jgi:hypothetical protein